MTLGRYHSWVSPSTHHLLKHTLHGGRRVERHEAVVGIAAGRHTLGGRLARVDLDADNLTCGKDKRADRQMGGKWRRDMWARATLGYVSAH